MGRRFWARVRRLRLGVPRLGGGRQRGTRKRGLRILPVLFLTGVVVGAFRLGAWFPAAAERLAVWGWQAAEWAVPGAGPAGTSDRAVRMVLESLPRYLAVEHGAGPRLSWPMAVRSWVFALTGYDFSQPETFLEAELPGYAAVARAHTERLRGPQSASVADATRPPGAASSGGTWPALPGPGTALEPGAVIDPEVRLGTGRLPERAPATREEVLASAPWGEQPLVAIIHSHPSEMYRTDTFAPRDASGYHLFDTAQTGIVRVGARLADTLWERYGIPTVHDTTLHNTPCHSCAYRESRKTVQELLRKYPSLMYVLDIHRDGAENVSMVTTVGSQAVAQVSLVVGRPAAGDEARHPNWQHNLAFASRLAGLIDAAYPGLVRRVWQLAGVYNQDLHPRFVLIEVGNYYDHESHALRTAELLADVLAEALYEDRFNMPWQRALAGPP